jgi:DNA invertase Pin-like site-specific DNA recombinase
LEACLEYIREGDTRVVTRLDRLARSTLHLCQIAADLERRQMDGIQKARERGVHFGRKKRLTVQQIAELRDRRDQGVLIKALMKEYGLSKVSVYR